MSHADTQTTQDADRPMKPAIWAGLRRKCPNCAKGSLFTGYLKVVDTCDNCGQDLHHHRADDGPAYLTILVVGHLMAPLIHIVFTQFRPEAWVMALGFTTGCVLLALYLLPRMKGLVVAIQWAKRMHGFGKSA
ncbi:Uncharacterized conserved protein, DUF983 family [Cognatiyoonia koreensis]|uniref:Uncharacterized conserved protein, DUF983 family n=1 Tax=Cognatiyoonia koreensis TaxID=364200 RepID=A0A1I0QEU0_9RHOB|nr:DUF983 domain-containing protein [Cognatiyoonia koreensis]SEW25456.1 Uncharacterized conserved protein, DUF983 family [Cognatiyoonia koreensis]